MSTICYSTYSLWTKSRRKTVFRPVACQKQIQISPVLKGRINYRVRLISGILLLLLISGVAYAQYKPFRGIPSGVDFSHKLQDWDGFGFNYVQTSHTFDLKEHPQEYGGFSLLSDAEKDTIVDMVFGDNGLRVGLVKMFLDPLHQQEPDGEFDHLASTEYMLEFVENGLAKTRARGADLSVITSLYGPPGWATIQKYDMGRDLDWDMKEQLAEYMIDWVRFLKKERDIPVKYLSVHNEGDDWMRWPWDRSRKGIFDYNMFWPHHQINAFLKFMPDMLKEAGLGEVRVTNGEPLNWYAFSNWGHATSLLTDKKALENLGLITSHGFYAELDSKKWYGSHNSAGIDMLRKERPELHAWCTSTSWGKMDAQFIWEIHGNIYLVKVNGIIPWAGIQRPKEWEGGDPNPGTAFRVEEDGSYSVEKGYYFYKQVSRAGQPGMAVALTYCSDSQASVIAFSRNGSRHADAFVIVNRDSRWDKQLELQIRGTKASVFQGFRTDGNNENYKDIGRIALDKGAIIYNAPTESVTTFFAVD